MQVHRARKRLLLLHYSRKFSRFRDRFDVAGDNIEIVWCEDQDQLEAEIGDADAVALTQLSPEAFASAANLEWIHCWSAGPDKLLTPEITASPVPVTSSKGNGAIPLAEHAITLMKMLQRDAPRWLRAQAERRWNSFGEGGELHGKTVTIVGLGHSGKHLAKIAKGFDMQVTGVRRRPDPVDHVDRIHSPSQLREAVAAADFVVVTAPLTAETSGMFDAAVFTAMKPTAFYINFSRGEIARDDALLHALRNGVIAGAGLDAHSVEPLPPDSPFWDLPNTIVTPHHGAASPETHERSATIFQRELRAYAAGEPFINTVDKAAGY